MNFVSVLEAFVFLTLLKYHWLMVFLSLTKYKINLNLEKLLLFLNIHKACYDS